ncbi:MAG: DNA cytosine methyltransferase [Butyricicoccus pullicaecorum]|nr:DNA cytosine methyltransferase [Butyricicoccus pullicaecorum]
MNILIACEESQAVTTEIRKLGHEAYSCDLFECSGGHPEWHIQGDCLPLLNGRCQFTTMDGQQHRVNDRWDMIIAFPPCTKTSNAGARHLYKGGRLNVQRYYEGMCGKAFFMTFLHADCDRIAVENPMPSKVFGFPEPTQVIQPYYFGHPYTKKTLLWLKGFAPLVPTKIVTPEKTWCPSGSYSGNHSEKHRGMFTTERARNRAKTFPGVAQAMAAQWVGGAD